MIYDADMFHSIKINEYVKMGLLTVEQIAKKQIDLGGSFSEKQQKRYIELQTILAEKTEILTRLIAKKDISEDEIDRKKILSTDIAILKNEISEYEYVKNQIYQHTANSKARNDVILWWVLNLTQFLEIKENESETDFVNLFEGESFETKKISLEQMEDDENQLLISIFEKLVKIITIWYWMGIQDKDDIKDLLEQE